MGQEQEVNPPCQMHHGLHLAQEREPPSFLHAYQEQALVPSVPAELPSFLQVHQEQVQE